METLFGELNSGYDNLFTYFDISLEKDRELLKSEVSFVQSDETYDLFVIKDTSIHFCLLKQDKYHLRNTFKDIDFFDRAKGDTLDSFIKKEDVIDFLPENLCEFFVIQFDKLFRTKYGK